MTPSTTTYDATFAAQARGRRRTGGGSPIPPDRYSMTLLRMVEDLGTDVPLKPLMARFAAAYLLFLIRQHPEWTAERRAFKAMNKPNITKFLIILGNLADLGFVTDRRMLVPAAGGKARMGYAWTVSALGRQHL